MIDEPLLLWHTTPLHYLPYLLHTGAILSAAQLAAGKHPIRPRPTAIARKTKLGLANYIHLSPKTATPLLSDKLRKGYPHALIAFDRIQVSALPGTALLKFNTKRWAHRDDFVPVTDDTEKQIIWEEYARGKYPSLEILVADRLEMSLATGLYFANEEEAEIVESIVTRFSLRAPPIQIACTYFSPDHYSEHLTNIQEYFNDCCVQDAVLPPPDLPFD